DRPRTHRDRPILTTARRSTRAGSREARTATAGEPWRRWRARSRHHVSLSDDRLGERSVDKIGDRLVDVRAGIGELFGVDDRYDGAQDRHMRVPRNAGGLEVHPVVQLALRDLEIDLGLVGEDLRRPLGVVDDPSLRALVQLDDLLGRLRVLAQEILARVEEAVRVEVLVAVDQPASGLELA